jgi:hypothetical protein
MSRMSRVARTVAGTPNSRTVTRILAGFGKGSITKCSSHFITTVEPNLETWIRFAEIVQEAR